MSSERVITVQRRLKVTPRTCVVCGREFPGWGRQRFCSKPCQRKWDYQRHAEQRRAKRREYYQRMKEEQHGRGEGARKESTARARSVTAPRRGSGSVA